MLTPHCPLPRPSLPVCVSDSIERVRQSLRAVAVCEAQKLGEHVDPRGDLLDLRRMAARSVVQRLDLISESLDEGAQLARARFVHL
jgi:hypothetical protein